MKDQITQDLTAMAAKVTPPVSVAVAAQAGAIRPESILIWLSILYTVILICTATINNWGRWMAWWTARGEQIQRLWAWMSRRG